MFFCFFCAGQKLHLVSPASRVACGLCDLTRAPFVRQFEASTAQELTDRAMLDDLYPKKTKKAVFKKPKARSKRRLMSKKKFQAA